MKQGVTLTISYPGLSLKIKGTVQYFVNVFKEADRRNDT